MSYLTSGNVMLVTGATGAIGFEIAAQAAAAGAIVAVHGSTRESVDEAQQRLQGRVNDAQLIGAPCDFRQAGAIEAMVAEVARAGGRLDAVVHCAITGASGISGVFAQADPASFGTHAALVLGCFEQLCFFALPHLAKQGGTIVGFASDAGRFAAPRQALVGGAFGGIMSFVRNLALETARDGVRVHCISPTFVENTPVFDSYVANGGRVDSARKRAGLGLPRPTDIAPVVLFLCGPGATRITGQVISINGGLAA